MVKLRTTFTMKVRTILEKFSHWYHKNKFCCRKRSKIVKRFYHHRGPRFQAFFAFFFFMLRSELGLRSLSFLNQFQD